MPCPVCHQCALQQRHGMVVCPVEGWQVNRRGEGDVLGFIQHQLAATYQVGASGVTCKCGLVAIVRDRLFVCANRVWEAQCLIQPGGLGAHAALVMHCARGCGYGCGRGSLWAGTCTPMAAGVLGCVRPRTHTHAHAHTCTSKQRAPPPPPSWPPSPRTSQPKNVAMPLRLPAHCLAWPWGLPQPWGSLHQNLLPITHLHTCTPA